MSHFSCEAIPEEISDATPPKQSQIDQQSFKIDGTVPVVASGTAKNQQNDFIAKSNATTVTAKDAQNPSLDSLTPFGSGGGGAPRKQHSADDALQQQQEEAQTRQQQQAVEPRHSSSGSSINIGASSTKSKLNIDMPNLATKPPQSHAPLSPRLLARNNLEVAHLNSANNFNDFQRGRSKTISVVRGEHDANRDNSKWTFKGSKWHLIRSLIVIKSKTSFFHFFYSLNCSSFSAESKFHFSTTILHWPNQSHRTTAYDQSEKRPHHRVSSFQLLLCFALLKLMHSKNRFSFRTQYDQLHTTI